MEEFFNQVRAYKAEPGGSREFCLYQDAAGALRQRILRHFRENISHAVRAGHHDAFVCIYNEGARVGTLLVDELICPGEATLQQLHEFGLQPFLQEFAPAVHPFQLRAEHLSCDSPSCTQQHGSMRAVMASWA
jgi:hypothetical protein